METTEPMKTAEINETHENSQHSPDTRFKMTALDNLLTGGCVVALGAGIFHGYCHSKSIEFDRNSFAASTLYGPTLLMAGFTSLKSVFGEYPERMNHKPVMMSIVGGVEGATFTGAGYIIGYAAGKTIGQFF